MTASGEPSIHHAITNKLREQSQLFSHPTAAQAGEARPELSDQVIPCFSFSPAVRKAVYTTNAIESLHSCVRRAVKASGSEEGGQAQFQDLCEPSAGDYPTSCADLRKQCPYYLAFLLY